MVPWQTVRGTVFAAVAAGLLAGCGSVVTDGGWSGGEEQATTTTTTGGGPIDPPPAQGNAYPGKGFIVHEWGTDTIVVGSDGSLQRGLHHEEEDLPPFVYDRIKAGSLPGATSVNVKMETPVTYFYSDAPLTAKVSVSFPGGVFTQWYPAVQSFYPFIAGPHSMLGVDAYSDPVFDRSFPFQQPYCAEQFSAVANGLLDWGSVEVLPRDAKVAIPDAPLETFTWSYARNVASNGVRISGAPGAMTESQSERFLFYRGLGNFELPLTVTAGPGGKVKAQNLTKLAMGTVFVLNVGSSSGAFVAEKAGVLGGGSLETAAPTLDGAPGLDAFVESLGAEVTSALDATGLYHDEAVAMVSTWKRQWFKTQGIRLLYLIPQSWTDSSIPLSIDPAPTEVRRVMMIRVEVITPELEASDTAAAAGLEDAAKADASKAYFKALGRFAEPRLRRALALLGDPAYGQSALAEVATANTSLSAGE